MPLLATPKIIFLTDKLVEQVEICWPGMTTHTFPNCNQNDSYCTID